MTRGSGRDSARSRKVTVQAYVAYKILIDENLRAKYERYGKEGMKVIEKINK